MDLAQQRGAILIRFAHSFHSHPFQDADPFIRDKFVNTPVPTGWTPQPNNVKTVKNYMMAELTRSDYYISGLGVTHDVALRKIDHIFINKIGNSGPLTSHKKLVIGLGKTQGRTTEVMFGVNTRLHGIITKTNNDATFYLGLVLRDIVTGRISTVDINTGVQSNGIGAHGGVTPHTYSYLHVVTGFIFNVANNTFWHSIPALKFKDIGVSVMSHMKKRVFDKNHPDIITTLNIGASPGNSLILKGDEGEYISGIDLDIDTTQHGGGVATIKNLYTCNFKNISNPRHISRAVNTPAVGSNSAVRSFKLGAFEIINSIGFQKGTGNPKVYHIYFLVMNIKTLFVKFVALMPSAQFAYFEFFPTGIQDTGALTSITMRYTNRITGIVGANFKDIGAMLITHFDPSEQNILESCVGTNKYGLNYMSPDKGMFVPTGCDIFMKDYCKEHEDSPYCGCINTNMQPAVCFTGCQAGSYIPTSQLLYYRKELDCPDTTIVNCNDIEPGQYGENNIMKDVNIRCGNFEAPGGDTHKNETKTNTNGKKDDDGERNYTDPGIKPPSSPDALGAQIDSILTGSAIPGVPNIYLIYFLLILVVIIIVRSIIKRAFRSSSKPEQNKYGL